MNREIKPKELLFAVMLSLLLPGLGQIYCGRIVRSIAIFWGPFVLNWLLLEYLFDPNTKLYSFFWLFLVAAICYVPWVLVDSYLCARAFNIDHQLRREVSPGKRTLLLVGILAAGFLNPIGSFSERIGRYIKSNLVEAFNIPSSAMSPTLVAGDRILVDKAIYKKSLIQRGDIIVFIYPEDHKKDFIKRVVGLPGETIEIRNGNIWINGALLESPAEIVTRNYFNCACPYGQVGQSVQIPEDSYFVLGDYSSVSKDSRYWGFVPRQNVEGKAYKIYYPFERSGAIR